MNTKLLYDEKSLAGWELGVPLQLRHSPKLPVDLEMCIRKGTLLGTKGCSKYVRL
jgi:hypothetical protein